MMAFSSHIIKLGTLPLLLRQTLLLLEQLETIHILF